MNDTTVRVSRETVESFRSERPELRGLTFTAIVQIMLEKALHMETLQAERALVFVEHIERHLTSSEIVVCKICGKNIDEIYKAKKEVERNESSN